MNIHKIVDTHKGEVSMGRQTSIRYYHKMIHPGRNIMDNVHKKLFNTYFIIVLNFPSSSFKSGVDSLEIMSGITL